MEFDINPDITIEQQNQFKNILNKYTDCFAKHSMDLGTIDVGDVPIPTLNEDPMSLPLYRLVLIEQKELQRKVN